jgi:glycosyltransferase involved in cell wall biosynthesis
MGSRREGFRLLEVGLRWPPETFLRRKLANLAARGVSVTVASPIARREAQRTEVPGVELIRLHTPAEPKPVSVLWVACDLVRLALRDPRLLVRLVRATRPRHLLRNVLPLALRRADVLHFEWEAQAVRYLPTFVAFARPVVVSCRGSGIYVHPHAGLGDISARYPAVFERATAVHCVAAAMLDEATRFGLDPNKARVIRSGVDSTFFSPAARSRASMLRVLSVGELNWIENHEDGIRAIAILAGQGVPVSYEIVGGEPQGDAVKASDRPRLLYLIHELGLTDSVRLIGRLSPAEVRDRLRSSDVLLHPSLAEGIANCVLEAMACALPVVVTDRGGMREAVGDGLEGIVCPARDPEALAAALRLLWDDPETARQLGDTGRRRAVSEFSPEREGGEYLRLYTEVLAGWPPTSPSASRPASVRRLHPPA